jgi:hypothetical protein
MNLNTISLPWYTRPPKERKKERKKTIWLTIEALPSAQRLLVVCAELHILRCCCCCCSSSSSAQQLSSELCHKQKNYWVGGTINKGVVGRWKIAHQMGEGTRCVCVSHVAQPPHESIAHASFVRCACLTCVHVHVHLVLSLIVHHPKPKEI